MKVIIRGMQTPEKCCKCQIYRKANAICPIVGRKVVDPGKKPDFCPLEEEPDICESDLCPHY